MPLQGTGTQADPYLIGTPADFVEYATSSVYTTNKWAKLTADINLNGISWARRAASGGGLLGNGKTISNISVDTQSVNDVGGVFKSISNYAVTRLRLKDCNVFGRTNTGIFAGVAVESSFAECATSGGLAKALNWVGGFVGDCKGNTVFTDCHGGAPVDTRGGAYGGALTGDNSGGNTVRCYTAVIVTPPSSILVSGGQQSNSYYDSEINGGRVSGLGASKTTAQMKTQSTFVGWDFTNVWKITEGVTYPELRAFDSLKFDSVSPSSVDVVEGANVEFSAVVSGGAGTVSYKWILNGTEVSTSNPHNRTMQFSDNGKSMICRATDGVTTIDSSAIPVLVHPTNEFKVYVDKSEIRLNESDKTTVTATAKFGTESPVFEWYKDSVLVHTGAVLSYEAVFSDNGKTIQCKGISGTEISYSEDLLITVIPVVLGVTISPATMSGIEGESKTFTALATGGRRTYSYSWLIDGVQRGAESPLSITLSASDAGKTLFCRVSDGNDMADSNSVVLSIIPTALSATISPSGTFKMAHGETQLFRCSPVGGGGNPYSYEWSLGGVVVSTSKDYCYKAVGVVDNGKQIQCKVVSGARNVTTNAVTLDIVQSYPYRITQGAESVDISPLYGYTTTIELSMERGTGADGIVQWLDNEQRYDDYKTAFQFFTANGNSGKIERMMCGDSVSVVNIVAPTGNGFRPFGIEYGTNYTYPVNVSEFVIDGRVDAFGDLMAYKMTIVPAVSNVAASYPVATAISDIETANHWTIGGVFFPFSQWMQELNDVRNVLITGGGSSQIVDTTKQFGDVAKISVNCAEDQARKIVQFITTLFRGTTQTADFPIGYCIFGKRYESITSCKVKLHSNILTVKHNGLNSLDIEFELQMVGL